ncbi:MAG: FtsX-like permease family protein [Chloroflexi bacterium]|nr:FtsX-like permease family protein [Chloroflexota bacterium]
MNLKNIAPAFIEALESLNANKMRSGLTILGIVIGVGAVIAMLALGEGVQASITGEINSVGSNLIFVAEGNQAEEVRNPRPLTLSDVKAISDTYQAPSVLAAVPAVSGSVEISYSGVTKQSSLTGTLPEYQQVRSLELLEGEFITSENQNGIASVAVIGVDVADSLYGRQEQVVGESIRLNGQLFRVIGLLKSQGGNAMGSQDNIVIVPFSTAQSRLLSRDNHDQVDVIYAQAIDADSTTAAVSEITDTLRARHRLSLEDPDDFTIFTQDSFLDMANTITSTVIIFLGGVAGISLLVGGIGIMNIMLVSVTERTREIGLRKALGAKKSDIMIQFLIESGLLSLLGGILGILLGALLSFAVSQIAYAAGTPLNPAMTVQSVLLATLFSAAVGIFFGIYPANRAASLEPVEALRHD